MRMNLSDRGRRASRGAALLGILALTLALSSCGVTPPDPEETVDSLNAIIAPPAESKVATEYDETLHPEPIAEPVECTPYLFITARGTEEPKQKKQLLSGVVKAVQKAFPDQVQLLDLDYPADQNVNEGGTYGARLLVDTLNVQAKACPAQLFLLAGYSQGALVIGDALSDPSERLVGATVGEVNEAAASRIVGMVYFGNPRFNGGEPYAEGSFDAKVNGLLPRDIGELAAYADRLRDYCVDTDFICQSSTSLDEQGHVAYFKNGMRKQAAAFLIDQVKAHAPVVAGDAMPPATNAD